MKGLAESIHVATKALFHPLHLFGSRGETGETVGEGVIVLRYGTSQSRRFSLESVDSDHDVSVDQSFQPGVDFLGRWGRQVGNGATLRPPSISSVV
jgi:hypothetical protein